MNTVSPGPVETALWLGPEGVAATVAKASGVDAETARQQVVASQGGSRRAASPVPTKSPIWCSSWPAIAREYTGADFVIDGGLIKTL